MAENRFTTLARQLEADGADMALVARDIAVALRTVVRLGLEPDESDVTVEAGRLVSELAPQEGARKQESHTPCTPWK